MSDPILYGYFRSSATWRVRIGLALKGIRYEYRPVNLLAGEQWSEAFGQVNPMHTIPALAIDGHLFTESLAILHFLDETRPTPPLLPADPAQRAHARRLAETVNSEIQPFQTPRAMKKLDEMGHVGEAGRKAWSAWFNEQGLRALEAMVRATAGTCCVGDDVTLADICLVPQLYGARRWGVPMEQFPTLLRIEAHVMQQAAFAEAVPSKQSDCPPGQV